MYLQFRVKKYLNQIRVLCRDVFRQNLKICQLVLKGMKCVITMKVFLYLVAEKTLEKICRAEIRP